MSDLSNYRTVYTTDDWRPGYTLLIRDAHEVPHLPIDVDYLTFQNCTFEVLDLTWLTEDSLKTLTIDRCKIREIHSLPKCTLHLRILNSCVETLEIPPHLEALGIDIDAYLLYPEIYAFPKTLKTLSLRMPNLDELPPLPTGLKKLCLTECKFPLPNPLPPNLKELLCFEMKYLSELPPLPESLTYLDCGNNALKILPELPPHLQYLDCSSNSIVGELRLPSAMISLECSHNRITSIPVLPPRIRRLDCSYNRIRELPTLPVSLRTLNFSANPIKRYPYTYDSSRCVIISTRGYYFKVLGTEKVSLDGVKVFPPYIDHSEWVNIADAHDDFDPNVYPQNEILELVLEVQRQVDTRKFLSAIKEELMAATWHPRRVEAWCGVNFSDPESD